MVDGDARRGQHVGEDAQGLERRRCPVGVIVGPASAASSFGRPWAVERWRVEVDAPHGVAHDGFGECPRRLVRVEHQRSVVASVREFGELAALVTVLAVDRQRLAQDGRRDPAREQHEHREQQQHDDDDDRPSHTTARCRPA